MTNKMILGPHGAVTQFIKIYQSQSALKKPDGVLNHSHTANSDAEGAIKNVEAVSVSVQERRHPHFI